MLVKVRSVQGNQGCDWLDGPVRRPRTARSRLARPRGARRARNLTCVWRFAEPLDDDLEVRNAAHQEATPALGDKAAIEHRRDAAVVGRSQEAAENLLEPNGGFRDGDLHEGGPSLRLDPLAPRFLDGGVRDRER